MHYQYAIIKSLHCVPVGQRYRSEHIPKARETTPNNWDVSPPQ